MNKFNQINLKDREKKEELNSRMQNFYINHDKEIQEKNNYDIINFKEMNNRLIKGINIDNINSNQDNMNSNQDKKTFKNDINLRMNNMTNHDLFYKRLPLNNNIRDYNVTIDTNKDEFNNRLSNYNLLSSNMNSNPENETVLFNSNFHKSFKEDTNKRLEELSPLSCNIGFPIIKPKKPNFSQNLEPTGNSNQDFYQVEKPIQQNYFKNNNKSHINNQTNIQNDINTLNPLQYRRDLPADTNQQYFFTNKQN